MQGTNTKTETIAVDSKVESRKLLNCKRVWVWGEARSWVTGDLCPESSNIPKENAVQVSGLSDWDSKKGFTWGEKTRGYSRASKVRPA